MRGLAGAALATALALPSAAQNTGPYLSAESRRVIAEMHRAISPEEMHKILTPFDKLDRISGGEGERQAADLLVEALRRYGVPHRVHKFRAYLSWPLRAELHSASGEARAFRAVTPAFSASTPVAGLEGEAVFVGSPGNIFGTLTQGYHQDVRGKIVVADGLITPQNARLAEYSGAIALVHINPRELLHEMIMTTVWGTPTPESARHIPKIPALSVAQADGEWLKQQAARGPLRLRVKTVVSTRWREIPLVEARVAPESGSEEFVLVSSHLDAWYAGMTDTASTDASILEMARILHVRRKELRRGFRFLWWTGHSTGRYAGSTWYADHFWSELSRFCVAYMNLDGPGARNVPLDQVSAWAWPELDDFARDFARELTGKAPQWGYFADRTRIFRPFRAGDSAFQGIGIPEVAIGLPEIPRGHPDHAPYVGGSERGWWWHTPEDSLDKIDMKALVRDTELRLAQLYTLATLPAVPYRISSIVTSYEQALAELARDVQGHFDVASLAKLLAPLRAAAAKADARAEAWRGRAPRPSDANALERLNRGMMTAAQKLNAVLYTSGGRYDQDPAAPLPVLPGLARARDLLPLERESDAYGFLQTRLVRERNRVEDTLREVAALLQDLAAAARP